MERQQVAPTIHQSGSMECKINVSIEYVHDDVTTTTTTDADSNGVVTVL